MFKLSFTKICLYVQDYEGTPYSINVNSYSLVKESPYFQLDYIDATLYLSNVSNPTLNQNCATESPKYLSSYFIIK